MEQPFRKHLIFYRRYIVDLLTIWDGDIQTVMNFLDYCNNNTFNIKFTSVVDEHKLVFLDLELTHDNEGNIITRTHFKSTAGNSYIHQKSCHHTKWKEHTIKPIL